MTGKVEYIELVTSVPRINSKANGFNFGDILKGIFDLDEFGLCQLYLRSKEGPFIYLETSSGTPIIINTKSSSETESLITRLKSELGNF